MMPIGRPADLGRMSIAAATNNTIGACLPGIADAVLGGIFVTGNPPIAAPFADVAVHIVEAPRIGKFLADGRIVIPGILLVPSIFRQLRDIIAKRIGGFGPSPTPIDRKS